MGEVRIAVRVRPGASRTMVGGTYGDPPHLGVAVSIHEPDAAALHARIDVLFRKP